MMPTRYTTMTIVSIAEPPNVVTFQIDVPL